MFKIFSSRRRPTEVICYPQKYTVVARIAGNKSTIVAGYGEKAQSQCMEFIDWFDNNTDEVFSGTSRVFNGREDIRVVRHHVSEVRAWSNPGYDYYESM